MKRASIILLLVLVALGGQAQKGKDQALEALGGSCGLLLYNTYLVVGMTADGFSAKMYDAAEANQILDEQAGGIEAIHEQYDALLDSGFLASESDQQFIKETLAAFDIVSHEIEALQKYFVSENVDDATEYDNYRKSAWTEISRLLDIE